MFYCCGITDTGCVRDHNEDAFLINKIVMSKAQLESELHTPFIVGVADGVAGENSGEVASRLALELVSLHCNMCNLYSYLIYETAFCSNCSYVKKCVLKSRIK